MDKKELKRLRENVESDINELSNKVKGINGNPLISILPLLATLGLAVWLKILAYWLPASFVVLFIWFGYSFQTANKKSMIVANKRELRKRLEIIKQRSREFGYWVQIWLKRFSTISKAVFSIFFINLITILLIFGGFLNTGAKVFLIIPLFITLFFIFLLYVFPKITAKNIQTSLLVFELEPQVKILSTFWKILPYVFVVMMVFFLISIGATLTLVENYALLILIILLQFGSLMVLSSYFSGDDMKTEINNSLTQLMGLKDDLIGIDLREEIADKERIRQLRRRYIEAKKFSSSLVDDTFKIVKLHLIIPNRLYIETCRQKDREGIQPL